MWLVIVFGVYQWDNIRSELINGIHTVTIHILHALIIVE